MVGWGSASVDRSMSGTSVSGDIIVGSISAMETFLEKSMKSNVSKILIKTFYVVITHLIHYYTHSEFRTLCMKNNRNQIK